MSSISSSVAHAAFASPVKAPASTPRRCAAFLEYEAALAPLRARFSEDAGLDHLLSPEADRELVELFLVHAFAQGVWMAEPTPSWLRRSAERCRWHGLVHLGRTLAARAEDEEGCHLRLIEDTRALVARVNRRRQRPLDASALLTALPAPGVARFRRLHEEVIVSASPFGQLAITLELERAYVTLGPDVLGYSRIKLGADVIDALGFLEERVARGAGLAHKSEIELNRLLELRPSFVGPLVIAGQAALMVCADFVRDSLALAKAARDR